MVLQRYSQKIISVTSIIHQSYVRPGGGALLAMEYLSLSSCSQQAALGSQLAKLHLHNKSLQVSNTTLNCALLY